MTKKFDIYERRRARVLVMQSLYEFLLTRHNPDEIAEHVIAESRYYQYADQAYFAEVWRGVALEAEAIKQQLAPYLNCAPEAVAPVELAILVLSTWELLHRPDVPRKVILDEAVELAKTYGGTEGHQLVNGVLDKLAAEIRKK
ncbi:MAG: transcription antitermination factor NusB [Burkholderiales bacterium]|jgi:N utilization substance protein B|nr:transcription antitermination factor NusB [Burkholderiales bacterium]